MARAAQVGGGFAPSNNFGYVPDTELLYFAAKATSGGLLYAESCINLPAPFPHRYGGGNAPLECCGLIAQHNCPVTRFLFKQS